MSQKKDFMLQERTTITNSLTSVKINYPREATIIFYASGKFKFRHEKIILEQKIFFPKQFISESLISNGVAGYDINSNANYVRA